ncbi:phage portal protein [Emticicia sp. BO119]|uniref:phage portal protein n=1 Tax=Emticicia sp. BO119 TaxID=2757768 RepID=UPI0015EFE510|nr:phage portal protein [Emticicia sp. BO119]MBA4852057.1 phage portal protein [Emticicia sp. BO119]
MKVFDISEVDDIEKTIKFFKDHAEQPKINELKKQYEVTEHPVFDPVNRPDRNIMKEDGQSLDRIEKVNRLGLPFQKKIVNASVSFIFGNPVKVVCQTQSKQEVSLLEAIKKILYSNKVDSFNRKIARDLYRATQVAEIWFAHGEKTDPTHKDYGFDTPYRIKVLKLSPWEGDELYPYFDKYGDMTAFCRAYSRKVEGKEISYFEVYTDEEYKLFEKGDKWEEVEAYDNPIKKIPIVFAQEAQSDWADVQTAIERLENLLSNHAEINDYHANPKIFVQGEIGEWAGKGEPGAVIQGELGSKAEYLSWDHAPESIKLEIDNLFKVIYSFTQTPDISFDTLKDLKQGISGVALEMLFMDAHLKVQEKREIFDEYLQRRISVIKAFIAWMNPGSKALLDKLDIRSEITPFMINDMGSVIKNLIEANGGKPILSQRTSVAKSGLVDDVDGELELIQQEEEAARLIEDSNPTI